MCSVDSTQCLIHMSPKNIFWKTVSMVLMKMLPESQDRCKKITGYLCPVKIYPSDLILLQIVILHLGMSLWPSKFRWQVSMTQQAGSDDWSLHASSLYFVCSTTSILMSASNSSLVSGQLIFGFILSGYGMNNHSSEWSVRSTEAFHLMCISRMLYRLHAAHRYVLELVPT